MNKRSLLVKLFSFIDQVYTVFLFVFERAGKGYKIGRIQKMKLVLRIIRNSKKVVSLSTWKDHLLVVEEILKIPPSLNGAVVECGCYNGAATVNFSLACAMTNRKLIVCDSFRGLPEPNNEEKYDVFAESNDYYMWEQGDEKSVGGLDGVKHTIEKLGDIEVCEFVEGYFKESLKDITIDSIVLVFEDVALRSSVEDCLRWLWPKLQEGCKFFSHEPYSIHVVSLFYDKEWWSNNLNSSPPGFFGSGDGIVRGLKSTGAGYSQKYDTQKIIEYGSRIIHPGLNLYKE